MGMFENLSEWEVAEAEMLNESEKQDSFIIQYHGYIALGEYYGVSKPEILPLTWDQFSTWWDQSSSKDRESLLVTLKRFL